MDLKNVKKGWIQLIKEEGNKSYFQEIINHLKNYDDYETFPQKKNIMRAFSYFEPHETKVVLLGQDPYIGYENVDEGILPQAMGLSFSVPKKIKKIPPSLKNLFIEIQSNYPDFKKPTHGNLKKWAKKEQILLLNAALTVTKGKSGSNMKYWEPFTDSVIRYLSENYENIIFILLGNFAKQKQLLINKDKHHIITAIHPSPLSAYRGFFGCNIFQKTNNILNDINKSKIDWNLD
ncbi:Uracil DNA glycosylase superfamily [seawater metagenome]|uniref:Uracil DNA glycosylase superfamily n=1 Tax=seawater metagenome TaxID=1561972 RepID=A0A5E8CHZ5_9ZZZZ